MSNFYPEFFHSVYIIITILPNLLQGCIVTIITVIGALTIGFILGVPMAILQIYSPTFIRYLVNIYVWFFRSIPILLLLFLFYFGLFELLGINFSTITTSCIVLGMTSAAYQTQIFKGSIQFIPYSQKNAAKALGMSDRQTIFSIILPQALRLSIPGWSNEYSILLKDSALCFVLGTPELMARTHFAASRTYEHLPLYIFSGLLYFLITLAGVYLLQKIEKRFYIPGYIITAR